MQKLMIITVGTSIFHSACWNKDHPDFIKELGDIWQEYCESFANPGVSGDPGGLFDPEKRRKEGKNLENFFKDRLKGNSAGCWPEWVATFDPPDSPAHRYSAEIATILCFAENEADKVDSTWQKVLEPYDFYFVHDSDTASLSGIAGLHNRTYLEKLLNTESGRMKSVEISGFSEHKNPRLLIKALKEFRLFLSQAKASVQPLYDTIDIVISGGFKVYGVVGYGFLLNHNFRTLYMHDESSRVIIQDRKTMRIDNDREEPFPAIDEE